MKNLMSKRAAAVFATLCLSACAHNLATAPAKDAAASAHAAPVAALPPDVLATCMRIDAESRAGHLAQAVTEAHACLASRELPVNLRLAVLEGLVLLEMAQQHNEAALDAQLSALDLSTTPNDLQLLLLASLYQKTAKYDDSLATLQRIRAAHEARHDLDSQLGMPWHEQMGATLAAMGRHDEAIIELTKAIGFAPGFAIAYQLRAQEREKTGDTQGARADYVEFARWSLDRAIDPATRAKLTSLGIDPAVERRHPFGERNPLVESAGKDLDDARQALKTATTPAARAAALHDISTSSDSAGRHVEALKAIDEAIALAPQDLAYRQSKVVTLVALNRIDQANSLATPILAQARTEAASSTDAPAVYRKYREVLDASIWTSLQRGDWTSAVPALEDEARASDVFDQDYLASLYVLVRAKSGGAAPQSEWFDSYIRRADAAPFALTGLNYRRTLLMYVQGRGVTIEQAYMQAAVIPDRATLQNALGEIWFMAAAWQRFVKHDDASAQDYARRVTDLKGYGTNEWTAVERGLM